MTPIKKQSFSRLITIDMKLPLKNKRTQPVRTSTIWGHIEMLAKKPVKQQQHAWHVGHTATDQFQRFYVWGRGVGETIWATALKTATWQPRNATNSRNGNRCMNETVRRPRKQWMTNIPWKLKIDQWARGSTAWQKGNASPKRTHGLIFMIEMFMD